jgi:hypothetical protein
LSFNISYTTLYLALAQAQLHKADKIFKDCRK